MKKLRALLLLYFLFFIYEAHTISCYNGGKLEDGKCICNPGFGGQFCQSCIGRFILTADNGTIQLGGKNSEVQTSRCMPIINPDIKDKDTLFVSFVEASGGCIKDYLDVYDGGSIKDPLLASFRNQMASLDHNEKISESGKIILKFQDKDIPLSEEVYKVNYRVEKDCDSFCQGQFNETGPPNQPITDHSNLYKWSELVNEGRSSFASASTISSTYLFGGVTYGNFNQALLKFDQKEFVWEKVDTNGNPEPRSFHTLTNWKNQSLIMFGGLLRNFQITNEIFVFNLSLKVWSNTDSIIGDVPPLMGHSAHFVKRPVPLMYIFFGYHPLWKTSDFIYTFNLETLKWKKVNPVGYQPHGLFGHASVLDADNGVVYLHGGYRSSASDLLRSFDTKTLKWKIYPRSPYPVYLHTMSIINQTIYLVGGRIDRDVDSCSNSISYYFDLDENTWQRITDDVIMNNDVRYGHGSLLRDEKSDKILIFGGYTGLMSSDVIQFTPTADYQCKMLNKTICDQTSKCTWSSTECVIKKFESCENICRGIETCEECTASYCNCCFDDVCSLSASTCKNDCKGSDVDHCRIHNNCNICIEDNCFWYLGVCTSEPQGLSEKCSNSTCSDLFDCASCTSNENDCIWCSSSNTCLSNDANLLFDPYFTCVDYIDQINECQVFCKNFKNCDECFSNKECGWCALNEDTGYGVCANGGLNGDYNGSICSSDDWHYVTCPVCQCNGHSNCSDSNRPGLCDDCEVGYRGSNCEYCDQLYYGSAENGGLCSPCQCNGNALSCNSIGSCNCFVFGMTGKHCDSCEPGFGGDAVNDSCFYEMLLNHHYVIDKSVMYDSYLGYDICLSELESIRFGVVVENSKPANLTVEINSTVALDNVTIYYFDVNMTIDLVLTPDNLRKVFGNPCVRLIIGSIEGATLIRVSINQTDYLLLKIVLGVSFSTILILVLGLGVWKARQYFQIRRLTAWQVEEEERRACRPFGLIDVLLDEKESSGNPEEILSPAVCREVLTDEKKAVYSVLFLLPSENNSSNHQLAIGSCLVGHEKPDDSDSLTVTITNSPKKPNFWQSFVRRLSLFSNTSPTTEARTTTSTTTAEDGFDNFALENRDEVL